MCSISLFQWSGVITHPCTPLFSNGICTFSSVPGTSDRTVALPISLAISQTISYVAPVAINASTCYFCRIKSKAVLTSLLETWTPGPNSLAAIKFCLRIPATSSTFRPGLKPMDCTLVGLWLLLNFGRIILWNIFCTFGCCLSIDNRLVPLPPFPSVCSRKATPSKMK